MDVFKKVTGASSPEDLLKQAAEGFLGSDYQKDYSHASALMRPNGLALAPKQKFLFHVYFNLNDSKYGPEDKGLIGALVKSIDLPSFNIDTETHIQYNRKRIVQNRINYDPINVKFHDDGEDIIRSLWVNYYQYHFADSHYQYDTQPSDKISKADSKLPKTNYNERDIYNQKQGSREAGWGKTLATTDPTGKKVGFFKDITIYGLNRGNFVSYTLINPVIVSWRHGNYDYADGSGVMEHDVQIKYEAVKYASGKIQTGDEINVKGFAHESRYDTEPGALGKGSTSLFGPGGVTDIFNSGNVAEAMMKAGASGLAFGNTENFVNTITSDAADTIKGGVLGTLGAPDRMMSFPNPLETDAFKSVSKALKGD